MTEPQKLSVYSMTGYANASCELTPTSAAADQITNEAAHKGLNRAINISVELRTVNSRFLEFHFRLPEELAACEPALREMLTAKLARGKVDVRINLQRSEPIHAASMLNNAALEQLAVLQQQVLNKLPSASPLRVNEILRWPGVLAENRLSDEINILRSAVLSCSQQALDDLLGARLREGNRLAVILLNTIAEMQRIVTELMPFIPRLLVRHQERVLERMREALGIAISTASESSAPLISSVEAAERIRQEVTLYGIRIDVAEELSRLSAHLSETQELLKKGGRLGKRLDFMMQELNREANTLGAKASALELADASMQLKLLIEQMREQVQNLE